MKKGIKRAGKRYSEAGVKIVDVRVVEGNRWGSEGLILTYLILLRASKVFAEDDGGVRVVYCSRGG